MGTRYLRNSLYRYMFPALTLRMTNTNGERGGNRLGARVETQPPGQLSATFIAVVEKYVIGPLVRRLTRQFCVRSRLSSTLAQFYFLWSPPTAKEDQGDISQNCISMIQSDFG